MRTPQELYPALPPAARERLEQAEARAQAERRAWQAERRAAIAAAAGTPPR